MKCFVLVFALVALTQSLTQGEKNIQINENGIVITGRNGRQITISRPNSRLGEKNIDISVSGPNVPTKRIQINDLNEVTTDQVNQQGLNLVEYGDDITRSKRSRTSESKQYQSDILTDILRQYQGVVDQSSYDKLLKRVDKSVQKGELSSNIYDILRELDQGETYVAQLGQQQGFYGQRQIYGQGQIQGLQQRLLPEQVQQGVLGQRLEQLLEENLERQYIRQLESQGLGQVRVPLTQQVVPGVGSQIYGVSPVQGLPLGFSPLTESGIIGRLYYNTLSLPQQLALRQQLVQQIPSLEQGLQGQTQVRQALFGGLYPTQGQYQLGQGERVGQYGIQGPTARLVQDQIERQREIQAVLGQQGINEIDIGQTGGQIVPLLNRGYLNQQGQQLLGVYPQGREFYQQIPAGYQGYGYRQGLVY